MVFKLSDAPEGALSLAFDPAELDTLRAAVVELYGPVRLNFVTQGDLGFGGESFILEDKAEPLKLVSMSPAGAEMLRTLAARVGGA